MALTLSICGGTTQSTLGVVQTCRQAPRDMYDGSALILLTASSANQQISALKEHSSKCGPTTPQRSGRRGYSPPWSLPSSSLIAPLADSFTPSLEPRLIRSRTLFPAALTQEGFGSTVPFCFNSSSCCRSSSTLACCS